MELPRLAVLLCTYNGGRYLAEQLHSIAIPDSYSGAVFASDDASTDNTLEVLERYARGSLLPLEVRAGPRRGHAANFLSLVCAPGIDADYFAYADQDDLWDSDKLARALEHLSRLDAREPALYCGRTRTVSERGDIEGNSPLFTRPPSFANALIHNIGGGNTMVFNRAAHELLQRAGVVDVVSHDWWTYLLVAGAGGKVIYDPSPSLSYRQHSANSIGANTGMLNRSQRYLCFLSGRNRGWNARNLQALSSVRGLLTDENQRLLEVYTEMREGGVLSRMKALRSGGFYAQTSWGNFGLLAATLLKKI
ncbi:glycosyl transferase family 2 [Halioglobus japonicus]|uniref:glycosyltransferase family 2 protein n=1 Tax=Halioglobus japonicus TaxID=930805 RepID=UPI00197A9172|nr:glycosyltransferase family 2 protein [Halioglobus japonicus]GHD13529.1 glycosyl transferase family 2 [Halioglobus japonicus]